MSEVYVYVLDKNGNPLMPTQRYGWVRRSLNSGKAKVAKKNPFTIKLTYETTAHTQPWKFPFLFNDSEKNKAADSSCESIAQKSKHKQNSRNIKKEKNNGSGKIDIR